MRKNQQDQTKTSNETGLGKSALEPEFRYMRLYIVLFHFVLFCFVFVYYNRKAKTNAPVILNVKLHKVLLACAMA